MAASSAFTSLLTELKGTSVSAWRGGWRNQATSNRSRSPRRFSRGAVGFLREWSKGNISVPCLQFHSNNRVLDGSDHPTTVRFSKIGSSAEDSNCHSNLMHLL